MHIWEIAIGGTSVFLAYNTFWYWNDMYWFSWGKLLLEYAGMLIIPIIGSHGYEAYLNKTAALAKAEPQTIKEELLSITAANGKEEIRLLPKDLLLVKAEDNYVRLVFLQNQNHSFILIRNTISSMEKLLKETSLMRCHRSFIVNASHLKRVLNQSGKLYIYLEGIDEAIPVSAKYQSYFDSPQIDKIRHKSPF